jgi:hypothetical protein
MKGFYKEELANTYHLLLVIIKNTLVGMNKKKYLLAKK